MIYTYEWTVFGYYGGVMKISPSKELSFTWYQVDDYGNLFESRY